MNKIVSIGILTFHNAENYGAVLQAYALQKTMMYITNSDTVFVINYKNKYIDKDYRLLRTTFINKRAFIINIASYFFQFLYIPKRILLKQRFKRFRTLFLNISNTAITEFPIIMYGSDQIWNPVITQGIDGIYFGCGNKGRKISYAVSDGGQLELTKSVLALIAGFDKVSCREKSFSEKIQHYLPEKKIDTVCDPVFLLNKEQWSVCTEFPKRDNYILVYKLAENDSIETEALILSKKLRKEVIQIEYIKSIRKWFCTDRTYVANISPQAFLGYFFNADFILTTSFHGTAFSIIFRKPFYSYVLSERAHRITDLLAECGLQERYIRTLPQTETGLLNYTDEIELKIAKYIKKSHQFLTDALGELHVF